MNFNEYQRATRTTAIYPGAAVGNGDTCNPLYTILGLVGEAGEVASAYKRHVRDAVPWDVTQEQLMSELGDCLWYVARCADDLGIPLTMVVRRNVAKLQDRAERGVIGGAGDDR